MLISKIKSFKLAVLLLIILLFLISTISNLNFISNKINLLDQNIALLTYNSITHKFYGETNIFCTIIYKSVSVIAFLIVFMCILVIFIYKKYKNNAIMILICLLIGPGIMVNYVLKDHWGRARPYQVIRDKEKFTPFWLYMPNKPNNNSFPSGHASIGFFLGAPYLISESRKNKQFHQKLGMLISIIGGLIVGVVRILQGGHYVTDVILCGIIVIALIPFTKRFYQYILKLYQHLSSDLKI